MVDRYWWADLFDRIFTIVKKRLTAELNTAYPKLDITSDNSVTKDNKFPTVYIHEISNPETAQTLEANEICGITETIQIDVYAKNMTTVKAVTPHAVMNMKRLMFSMVSGPIYTTVDGISYGFVRCRRTFTHSDSI